MTFIHPDLWDGKSDPSSHQRSKPSHTFWLYTVAQQIAIKLFYNVFAAQLFLVPNSVN